MLALHNNFSDFLQMLQSQATSQKVSSENSQDDQKSTCVTNLSVQQAEVISVEEEVKELMTVRQTIRKYVNEG